MSERGSDKNTDTDEDEDEESTTDTDTESSTDANTSTDEDTNTNTAPAGDLALDEIAHDQRRYSIWVPADREREAAADEALLVRRLLLPPRGGRSSG